MAPVYLGRRVSPLARDGLSLSYRLGNRISLLRLGNCEDALMMLLSSKNGCLTVSVME